MAVEYDGQILAINIPKILEGFGLSVESGDHIRLKGGIVGKTTYALVALMGVLAILAYKATPSDVMPIVWTGVSVFVLYFIGVLVFGFYNPGAALLEGAELIRWRKMGLESKTIPHPKDTAVIADPSAPIPLPNQPDRNDQ